LVGEEGRVGDLKGLAAVRPDGAHLDTGPEWNGLATSSSPFPGSSQGDEDIVAPPLFPKEGVSIRPDRSESGWRGFPPGEVLE
jgi:hypothetical protein